MAFRISALLAASGLAVYASVAGAQEMPNPQAMQMQVQQIMQQRPREAEAAARERNGVLAGFYHSHPNEPARPSQYDLDHAWPNFIYVIISVNAGVPGDVTVWRLRDDRSGFDEGELKWHTGS